MSQSRPVGTPSTGPVPTGQTFCYLHPKTPATLRCTRCDRPICGRCAIPAAVGQHCPGCVAEARRSAPRVRSVASATAPAVVVIVAINALFYLGQQVSPDITLRLASIAPAIAAGEWYRLLTPMVLHANLLHILFNSYVFWIYGPELERPLGTVRFLATYVISGFIGSAASYALGDCTGYGVGASGAIFGVMGALLVYLYRRRTSASADYFFRGLVGLVALNLVISFFWPVIDEWAHVGGLVGGILMGGIFDQHKRSRPDLTWQIINTLAVVALGVGLVVWRTTTFTCP